jgi:hypothetical protein
MTRRTGVLLAATIVGLSVCAFSGALAEQSENDALQIKTAKISLTDAIAAAEAKTGGKASKAEFEQSPNGWVFDVEIIVGDAVSDVKVNPENGAVMSVTEDKIDTDEGENDAAD